MQAQSLIAVCDILGSSDLVSKQPLEAVVGNAVGWFRKALKHSVLGGDFATSPPPTRDLDGPRMSRWLGSRILFCSIPGAIRTRQIGALAGCGVFTVRDDPRRHDQDSHRNRYGEAHMDPGNSIYVGVPIVQAHQLERKQE